MTGHKGIDQLIQRYGLLTAPGEDAFQRLGYMQGGDRRAENLPFCMYQKVMQCPVSHRFSVHQFFLPNKKGRLATFLFDEKGQLIEQVYYVRLSRLTQVCKKLEGLLRRREQDMKLAA